MYRFFFVSVVLLLIGDTMLEEIRLSLDNNTNLTREVKANLFELVTIFNNKFPSVALVNLNNRLGNLKIVKSDQFLNEDVSLYDFKQNILYMNKKALDKSYDVRHVLMFELLNMITATNFHLGFDTDGRLEALNVGYTEVLANYLVGNNGEELVYPEEAIVANMITVIVGSDAMVESYFNNDSKTLLNRLVEMGVKL